VLQHNGVILDEVVVSLFKAPRSFTGEDVAEISCHGSPYIVKSIIEACTALGARPAKAGEFTQRAFLNGKKDLVQAEAVADLIASDTKAAQQAALHNMRGGFSQTLKAMRESLVKFASLMELELDFATEDVEFADRSQFFALIHELKNNVSQLLQSFQLGNVIRNGVKVAIIGKPNAGKSTLLNALLQEERAIVSNIAGTTRDTIEEVLYIDGLAFRLIDTAGIRDHSADSIEQIGISKSREKMVQADIVLYLFDASEENRASVEGELNKIRAINANVIPVANKTDISKVQDWNMADLIRISAKEGVGIEDLKKALISFVLHNETAEGDIVTNTRHFAALQQVLDALITVENGLNNGLSGDLLTIDINRALHYLGEITGEVTTEDKLDYIFSKFCIGK
jgi:tRNA modification GTPase